MLSIRQNLVKTIKTGKGEYIPYGIDALINNVVQQGMMDEAVNGGTDIWGVYWEKTSNDHIAMVAKHPVNNIEELVNYSWPNPEEFKVKESDLEIINSKSSHDKFLMAHHTSAIFERAWELIGMDNLLIEMILNEKKTHMLCEKIGDYNVEVAKKWMKYDIDAVGMSDDYGTERSLLFKPELFKKYIKPQLVRIVDIYNQIDMPVMLHSCGKIEEIVDDIVEIGIRILNPIQASCNNLEYVRKRTQGKVVLYGGIDNRILMNGKKQEIIDEINRKVDLLGRDGYYIAAPDQYMPFSQSTKEIFIETMSRMGKIGIKSGMI